MMDALEAVASLVCPVAMQVLHRKRGAGPLLSQAQAPLEEMFI